MALIICVVLAFAAAPAFATTPTDDAYSGVAGTVEGGESDSNGSVASDDSGTLPFTGVELSLIALVGVGLLGTGIAIRRASRSRA